MPAERQRGRNGQQIGAWTKRGYKITVKVFWRWMRGCGDDEDSPETDWIKIRKTKDMKVLPEELLKSVAVKKLDSAYEGVTPIAENRYSFRAMEAPKHYLTWPTGQDLCMIQPLNGPVERRGNALISLEKSKLDVVRDYLDPKNSNDQIGILDPRLMRSSGEFNAEVARKQILKRGVQYHPSRIVRYPFKPFDVRFAYLDSDIQPLFSRPSPELLSLRTIPNNSFLITRDTADKYPEGSPFYYSRLVCDYDCISGHARHVPIWTTSGAVAKSAEKPREVWQEPKANVPAMRKSDTPIANLSQKARDYPSSLGIQNPDSDPESAGLVWMHAIAIGYLSAYLIENANGIRVGWPRLPLPRSQGATRICTIGTFGTFRAHSLGDHNDPSMVDHVPSLAAPM